MYLATYAIDVAALIYLIGLLHSSTALNSERKRPFLIGIILILIIVLSEAGTVFTNNGLPSLRNLNVFCNILGFALTPMLPITIARIFDSRLFRRHQLLLIPTFINVLAAVLSPWYRVIFYVDSNNQYVRGEYFYIFIVVYIVNFLFLVISTMEVGKQHNYPMMGKLAALSLFTILGTNVQLIFPQAYSSWHCVTLALLLYFLLLSEFDSSFDTLTGLYNRAAFDKATKHLADTKGFSVVMVDINDFKRINDAYGHDYGDTVIKAVANVIRQSFSKSYTCYRYGGDEFSIIGSETDREKVEHQLSLMANNLAVMCEQEHPLPTVSYGYSIYRGGGKPDFQKSFKEADNQMYHSKKNRKSVAADGTTGRL